jgi:hypothetical protein
VVDEVPLPAAGEQRVLGQTLSPEVALLRNEHRAWWRQRKDRVWADMLTKLDHFTAADLLAQLRRACGLKEGREHWGALPVDLACHPDVEAFTVPPGDPRVGLRGQRGLRV